MTLEGRIAVDIGVRPGIWKRAGQVATIVGLDWPAAIALIPAKADKEKVERLLTDYEAGLIAGSQALAKQRADEAESD